jgi:hypothetical protein
MDAFMTVFVDELLWGETQGFRIVDHSKDVSDPDRVFWMKVILLFWVGDYPGLGKCAAMKHAGRYGCHWCKGFFYAHSQGHNVCIHNRRNLRMNHPYRTDERWGLPETRTPIPMRYTGEVEAQARKIHGLEEGPEKTKKQKETGIDGFCLFLLLSMFDIVWDMLPDMMHITKGSLPDIYKYNALFMMFVCVLLQYMMHYSDVMCVDAPYCP